MRNDTVVCDKCCQCSVVIALFASSLSFDCSASRMSSKGLPLFSQWWREQKTRNFVKNHPAEGGFLEFHSIILCYSFQWRLTTSYLVLPIFSSVSFLLSLWDLLFILFFNYPIVIWHLVKWGLRTNEVERVCHARMLFDKITVQLQHLTAAKGGSPALAFPAPSPLSVFTWFSTLNGQR